MSKVQMDVMCELASAIVERQWNKENFTKEHSFTDDNGDIRYVEEVQDEFNAVLDIIDDVLNPEPECLHNYEDGICKTCGAVA